MSRWLIVIEASSARSSDFAVHVGERSVVEDPGCRVANFFHRDPHAAGLFVHTFCAGHIGRLADTRYGSQRPIQYADNFAEGNVCGPASEKISAALAFLAFDDAVPLQSSRIASRNFCGIASRVESSRPASWPRTSSPYFDFRESTGVSLLDL